VEVPDKQALMKLKNVDQQVAVDNIQCEIMAVVDGTFLLSEISRQIGDLAVQDCFPYPIIADNTSLK
jgi:hypothetical protein